MKEWFSKMTFRSKILSVLLIITIFLGSFSIIVIQSLQEMNRISDDLSNNSLPEHFWLSHWEQELMSKEYIIETALNTDFCCGFLETYERHQSESEEKVSDAHGEVPESLHSLKRDIDLLDFTITNNVRGLIEYNDYSAAANLVEEDYLPQLEDLQSMITLKRDDVIVSLEGHTDRVSSIINEALWLFLMIMTLAILVGIIASYRISAGLTKPVDEIEGKLDQIASGDYGLLLENRGQIELQSLTSSINKMSLRLKESFNTIINDKVYHEQILNSLPLGIVTYEKKTEELSLNETAKKFLDNDSEAILDIINQGIFTENKAFWHMISSPEIYQNIKIPFYSKEGDYYFLVSQSELKDCQDDVIGKVFYFLDITETEELEKKIQQTEKLALVGELSAGAAHEIRNPLAVIDGFLSLMNKSLSKKEREQFHIPLLIKELERINVIIEEMLMLTKPSAPKMEITFLEDIINDILPLINDSLGHEDVIFELSIERIPLYMDAEQIKQVFHNLIRNSIEAMAGKGEVTIHSDADEGNYHIYIEDTGPGIPEKLQKNIFSPFLTSKDSGTGLGLTIAQRIMDTHNGKLTLVSSSEKGTCFQITLPIPYHKKRIM
ncbi:HAMP domain-containing protein [Salipaludibacillus agaradhaerens]|uniref:histidine kinase n=1 Tax=Salipaludibacillus agaradhaerens TaxID=76935 RepID=A0A9Q4FXS7_SALAG|nr:ATP-binding protein [Salipaludibacillus agaradhaerens]MCR6095014.1 HAMP domain-containing protein [Salipaludibacillus agaradhaerens]MCR6115428.1 HAMP domain-containing protein [Salipaludibacillus agaradhaerens]